MGPTRTRDVALVGVVAVGLVLAVFGPVLPQLAGVFLGREDVDTYGTQWFYWYVGEQILSGHGFGWTDLYFFPWGKDVYTDTGGNVLDALVALPLRALLGPTVGYNVFCLLALLANGLAFDRLVIQRTRYLPGRIVGAVLYALAPFLLFELEEGRPTQVMQPFLPLFFAHLFALKRKRVKDAVLAGLFLALTGLTYWFYALFAGLVAIVHFAVAALAEPRRLHLFGLYALAAVVSLVLTLPFAGDLALRTATGGVEGLLAVPTTVDDQITRTLEGLDVPVFVYQPLTMSVGFLSEDRHGVRLFERRMDVMTLGQWLGLVVGLVFWRRRGMAAGLFAMVLAVGIGPVLWLGGETQVLNPIWVGLERLVPPLQRLWWPGRVWAVGSLVVALATAAGLAGLRTRLGEAPALAVGVVVLLLHGVGLFGRGYLPYPTWEEWIPAGYQCLAQEDGRGAVIELPYGGDQAHVFYQTAHGHPILGGMREENPVFVPDAQEALREDNLWLSELLDTARGRRIARSDEDLRRTAREELVGLGYRWAVVLHAALDRAQNARISGERSRSVRRLLNRDLGAAVWSDADLSLFSLDGSPSPCGEAGPGVGGTPRPWARGRDVVDRLVLGTYGVRSQELAPGR